MAIVTAPELAGWLGIPDSEDDVRLSTAVAATNRAIVRYCGRSFETVTSASASARTFAPKTPTLCYTDDFHTTDGLIVKTDAADDGTYETTLTVNTDYFLEPTNGIEDGLTVPYHRIRSTSWLFPQCSTRPSVQVTAAWGWASVPDEVKQAGLLKAARLFKRKDSVEGVLGGFQDFNAVTVRISTREDPDVVELLRYYRTAQAQLLVT
jgi:hypothetical protein